MVPNPADGLEAENARDPESSGDGAEDDCDPKVKAGLPPPSADIASKDPSYHAAASPVVYSQPPQLPCLLKVELEI